MIPDLSPLRFDAAGLIPAICQEAETGTVLLLGFMNATALERTLAEGTVWFWSRSRQSLWKKGEQSGHVLHVRQVAVNCEGNSLLLTVTLDGPGACHDGYHSCYYRALTPAGTWLTIAAATFDPGTVYALPDAALSRDWRALYAGYARLRDHDFRAHSHTSRLLHDPTATPAVFLARAMEELTELSEVLAGTHQHAGGRADILLESSQVGYWLCLAAITARYTYEAWHPDRVLLAAWTNDERTSDLHPPGEPPPDEILSALSTALSRLGALLAQGGVHPAEPVARDLASLRERLASLDDQAR